MSHLKLDGYSGHKTKLDGWMHQWSARIKSLNRQAVSGQGMYLFGRAPWRNPTPSLPLNTRAVIRQCTAVH